MLTRKLTLNEVAEAAGVSLFYLERLFKKETSETPRAFWTGSGSTRHPGCW